MHFIWNYERYGRTVSQRHLKMHSQYLIISIHLRMLLLWKNLRSIDLTFAHNFSYYKSSHTFTLDYPLASIRLRSAGPDSLLTSLPSATTTQLKHLHLDRSYCLTLMTDKIIERFIPNLITLDVDGRSVNNSIMLLGKGREEIGISFFTV